MMNDDVITQYNRPVARGVTLHRTMAIVIPVATAMCTIHAMARHTGAAADIVTRRHRHKCRETIAATIKVWIIDHRNEWDRRAAFRQRNSVRLGSRQAPPAVTIGIRVTH